MGDADPRSRPPWRSVLLGCAVGLGVGLVVLDPGFITGTGETWTHPQNDVVMYLVAWNYYLADVWRFPLFSIPAMGYPEGGSVLFNDALPLAALPTKLLHSIAGVRVNPFGCWILLTYVLQGALAARLASAAGARSPESGIAAATFAVCSWPFLFRLHLGHLALSGHFVILWALALYFESSRRAKPKTLEFFALASTTLLINSYLFVMVMVIVAASGLSLLTRRRLGVRDLLGAAVCASGLIGIAILAGYGVVWTNPSQMESGGFEFFSWNLVALLLPPDGVAELFPRIPRDATTGQYEGESYIGDGALLVLVVAAITSPRMALRAMRRHAWLCLAFVALATFAASDRVYLGERLLIAYDLPGFLGDLSRYFRASGRFIWPLAYGLMVLPVALVFRARARRAAIAVALVGIALQVADARPFFERGRIGTSAVYPDLLGPRVTEWIAEHERVWQYPSRDCGSLSGPELPFGGPEENLELQIQLAASRAGVPTNSVSTSRVLKDCEAEAAWARHPVFEKGVLYLIAFRAARESAPLARIVRPEACVRLPWAIACSTTLRLRDPRSAR